jgi:restriction system protein
MGRRSKNEGIPEMLLVVLEFVFQLIPPWTSIPIAAVGFFLIVLFWDAQVKIPVLQIFGLMFGAGFAILCLIAGWKGAEFRHRQQEFLEADIDIEWVRGLSWRGFEHQLAEVYRQKGYEVEETGGGGGDGGIDLKLFKDGRTTIVQCKHWKTWKVNVKPVRELFGVMTAERADSAIFITSGGYTSDALKFAEGKPIELIDQHGFLDLVRCFQKALQEHYGVEPADADAEEEMLATAEVPPRCPICQSPMKLRTATRGKNAGSQFWGCSRFPNCRGTRSCQIA